MPLQDVLKPLREATTPAALELQKLLQELENVGLNTVTELQLKDRSWTEEHAHWLSAILLRLPNLKELHLEGNPIGPEGARAIARSIRGHRFLEVLDLEDCKIGRIGARSIISAIQPPKTPAGPRSNVFQHSRKPVPIRVLDLEGNCIDDSLSELIGRFCRQNTTTLELDLEDNSIGDKTAEEIARALSYNRTLKQLDLSGNQITSAGMAFMTRFFSSRSVVAPVEDLNLSGNKIESSALDEFATKAMKINPFLKNVDLAGNVGELSETAAQSLKDYIARNNNPNAKQDEENEKKAKKKSKKSNKKQASDDSESKDDLSKQEDVEEEEQEQEQEPRELGKEQISGAAETPTVTQGLVS